MPNGFHAHRHRHCRQRGVAFDVLVPPDQGHNSTGRVLHDRRVPDPADRVHRRGIQAPRSSARVAPSVRGGSLAALFQYAENTDRLAHDPRHSRVAALARHPVRVHGRLQHLSVPRRHSFVLLAGRSLRVSGGRVRDSLALRRRTLGSARQPSGGAARSPPRRIGCCDTTTTSYSPYSRTIWS